jgi:hypothetical protein
MSEERVQPVHFHQQGRSLLTDAWLELHIPEGEGIKIKNT